MKYIGRKLIACELSNKFILRENLEIKIVLSESKYVTVTLKYQL